MGESNALPFQLENVVYVGGPGTPKFQENCNNKNKKRKI